MAKKGKSSKTPPAEPSPPNKKGKGKKNQQEEAPDPTKSKHQANRAKVTSTSSWTGKLPHSLLHEHCQKRKWNKVEYDMKKIGDKGMIATAVLSYTDPKTRETLTVRMMDPTYDKSVGKGVLLPQETPVEARHMAATVALCRIAFNTNLHMMLPPNHKKLWYELDDYRKKLCSQNSSKCDRIFDPEPFKSMVEEKKTKDKMNKELVAKQQQAEKVKRAPILVTSVAASDNSKPEPKKRTQTPLDKRVIKFPKKLWDNAAFIDLEESSRNLIEQSLKLHIDWDSKKYKGGEDDFRTGLKQKLLAFGFRAAHVDEALDYEDPLAFLLFNLPEDDLPSFFHKRQEDSKMRVKIAKLPLPVRNMVDRLMESGVSNDEAIYALERTNFDEAEAAGYLTSKIIPQPTHVSQSISADESMEIWVQELESLQSIYGDDKIEVLNNGSCYTIKLIEKFNLKLKVYKTLQYPLQLPGIIVSTFDRNYKLPNYIKQQILMKLLCYVTEAGLLGDMLVFNLFEWLEQHLVQIIENPGPLLSEDDKKVYSQSEKYAGNGTSKKSKTKYSQYKVLSSQEVGAIKKEYKTRIVSADYTSMLERRSKLPAWRKQDLIVDLISSNDVVLITGETGSGKSTQVVQFLLDDLVKKSDFSKTKIICTQPRRISAIGLAERVADERCVNCGEEVGYVIRGVNKTKSTTRIRFMTTGILVRVLQGDKSFLKNSIVVIDEVHERSIDTDLIVILLKNLMGKIPGLKIVLMSATVNVDVFKNFFSSLKTCHIEGRTFPIQDYFLDDVLKALDFKIKREKIDFDSIDDEDDKALEDASYLRPTADSKFFRSGQINYDLLTETAFHVDKRLKSERNDGSIIIFLPGVGEINRCCDRLRSSDSSKSWVILPLHSALTPDDQKRVFNKYANKRKIVVSTNIAETSITIDDCVATIDTGRVKTMYYNSKDNTTKLTETFVSRAEAKQRRGRAGRVREGYSYKLFSKNLYEQQMVELPTPEIKRVGLESLYLSVKSMGIKDVLKFLSTGLDPPPLKSLQKSEQILTTVGLLHESDKSLTELGRFISLMPVMDSKHGKLLIYSIIFGCTDLGVLIASILSIGAMPFVGTFDNRDKIKQLLSQYKSRGDLLAVVEIVRQYLRIEDNSKKRKFMNENMLSYTKMKDILSSRTQYFSILEDVGFLPMRYKPGTSKYLNRNENNIEIIKCILTGAFYPQVARVQLPDPKFMATSAGAIEKDPEAKSTKYWIRNEEYIDKVYETGNNAEIGNDTLPSTRAFLHPSSVLFSNNIGDIAAATEDQADEEKAMIKKVTSSPLKSSFVVYNTLQLTSKLYLRDLTPTSTLALLLFGGSIKYDMNSSAYSPGIVVDNWLPIRTWCKNGVLIKELRYLLDQVIREKLENPDYTSNSSETSHDGDDVLKIVEDIIQKE